jgi:hypothetical protein
MDLPDVIWTSPSTDEHGSMPLGNGETAINLWTEHGRDLCLYLARTDAWDGDGRLCKLGRLRLRLPEGVFAPGAPFSQRLDLATATVRIRTDGLAIAVWVDAHAQAVRIELTAREPLPIALTAELWRSERTITDQDELFAFIRQASPAGSAQETADEVLTPAGAAIAWGHRNRHSAWAGNLANQYLADWARDHAADDPLLGRAFGCLVAGDGLTRCGPLALAGEGRRDYAITVTTACAQVASAADLLPLLTPPLPGPDQARPAHAAWWAAFWARSWIRITGDADAAAVSQAYALQRFLFACAGRGRHPIKFNGSLFTVGGGGEKDKSFTPDWRRWGGCYWFQNTRLAYWPMVMAGDAEMTRPLFRMYQDCLPLARARTRAHHQLPGAVMPETVTFWGTWGDDDYGYPAARAACLAGMPQNPCHHPLAGPDDRHALNGYLRHYFTGALELLALGLDLHATAPDAAWLKATLVPLARDYLAFFAAYWAERSPDGRLRMEPAMALETWQDAARPLPDIAGLAWVIDRLLALPDDLLEPADRTAWQTLRAALPPLPQRSHHWAKLRYLIPAERYDRNFNCENPELYAVFPFRLLGVGKPDLDLGRETWKRRANPMGAQGWSQDPIQAALLGLAGEARAMVVQGATTKDPRSRFPAFWGPNFDWVPDQDHGGALMIALQRMVLQAEPGRIDLLPAWPADWAVDFRLHVPGGVATGTYRAGTWLRLDLPAAIKIEHHQAHAPEQSHCGTGLSHAD